MRYYNIVLGGGKQYTSFPNGATDPGALNIVLDAPVTGAANPINSAYIQIWGISLQDISQASNLNNQTIQVYGGFQAGLPLANPAQAGLLVQGYVFQAFGNWIGTDMTLDIVINAGPGPKGQQVNLTHNWPKQMPMSTSVKNALSVAYPGIPVNVNISPNLVLNHDEPGFYRNITQFATYIKQVSKDIMNSSTYNGVNIVFNNNTINVFDNTMPTSKTTAILYQDLIGQPTWIDAPNIQVKCAMRGDLSVGNMITLPQTLVNNTQQAQSSLVNQSLSFQGSFQIQSLRHIGNFRQPDAASWVTVIDAFPTQTGASPSASS